MERILTFLFGCLLAIVNFAGFAQSSQITTLMSNDEVKIYYGPQSFKQAVADAADGDVITMSAGIFDSPGSIKKTLTVRGAGIGLENYKPYIPPTIINGDVYLSKDFTGEGLRFNSTVYWHASIDATFNKCYINELLYGSGVLHCTLVQSQIYYRINSSYIDMYAVNSVLYISNYNNDFNGIFINCMIVYGDGYGGATCIKNSTFTNCIIRSNTSNRLAANETTVYYNCLFYGKNNGQSFDNVMRNGTCYGSNTIETVFKDTGYYELQDTYKTMLGVDGKELGIYGGNLGFDLTPNNPQITRFNVAPKTSVDGKLSIELEVKGSE